MANRNRISTGDKDFNNYINGTADYLLLPDSAYGTNWERLGLLGAEKDQWIAFRDDWNTTYGIVVTNNGRGIRDSNATKAKNDAKKAFTSWALDKSMNKLNRIGASPNVINNDRAVFNIKKRDDIPTPRAQITTAPLVDFKGRDGGVVLITCRVQGDSDRASMHPDADVIEMKYILIAPTDKPPGNSDEFPNTATSTRAIFRFKGAVGHPGKRMHAFLRWRNNAEKGKSGPWSQRMTIIIGD